MDNDGDLDLYVNGTVTGGQSYPDYLFRNTGSAFEDVTTRRCISAWPTRRPSCLQSASTGPDGW